MKFPVNKRWWDWIDVTDKCREKAPCEKGLGTVPVSHAIAEGRPELTLIVRR